MRYVQNFSAQVKLLRYDEAQKKNERMLIVGGRALLIPVWFECPAQFTVYVTNIWQSLIAICAKLGYDRYEQCKEQH